MCVTATLQRSCHHDHVAKVQAVLQSAQDKIIGIVMEQCVCSLEDAVYHAKTQAQREQQQQQQQLERAVFQLLKQLPPYQCGSGVPLDSCSSSACAAQHDAPSQQAADGRSQHMSQVMRWMI